MKTLAVLYCTIVLIQMVLAGFFVNYAYGAPERKAVALFKIRYKLPGEELPRSRIMEGSPSDAEKQFNFDMAGTGAHLISMSYAGSR